MTPASAALEVLERAPVARAIIGRHHPDHRNRKLTRKRPEHAVFEVVVEIAEVLVLHWTNDRSGANFRRDSEESSERVSVLSMNVFGDSRVPVYSRHSSAGMMRRMNSSKSGTVNAVSPWLGLQIIPFAIN